MFLKTFQLTIISLFIVVYSSAQNETSGKKSSGIGIPFVHNFSSDDFSSMSDTRAILEDSLGIMYFAGTYGVLLYDGVTWENIKLSNGSHAMSMAIDRNNKIFVGGNADIGYLDTNSSGKTQYISLLSKLEDRNQKITTVWETIATKDGVYFKTAENLYYWDGEKLNILNNKKNEIKKIFLVRDTLLLKTSEGYGYFDNDKIRYLEGSKRFANKIVTTILPYKENSFLLGTYREGVLLYNREKLDSKSKVEHYFTLDKVSYGAKLNNGQYVFSTFNNGISVVDNEAVEIFRIDNADILNSLSVQFVYQSKSGLLWLGHRNGISKIEYPSPYTEFGKHSGIKSRTHVIKQYDDSIFVSTVDGLKVLNDQKFELYKSQKKGAVFDFIKHKNAFLVAHSDYIKIIQGNSIEVKPFNQQPTSFQISSLDSNRVYLSTGRGGLNSIYFDKKNWLIENKINCKIDATYIITEMDSGNLWLNTYQNWIWNIRFETPADARLLRNPVCVKFDQNKGLPSTNGNLFKYENELYFSGGDTYKYNPKKDKFELANDLKRRLNTDGKIRIYDLIGGSERIYYDDKQDVLWLTGNRSVIRHNLSNKPLINKRSTSVINKIFYQSDSLVSYGVYHSDGNALPFKDNSFRFQYANTSYYEEEKNLFQYQLTGFEEDWSDWSLETQKDYTNIPEGDYTFKVRAKNVLGKISQEDSYNFTILPPWYRTWWAYLLYALGGILTLILFSQWRSQQLKAKNVALEKVVDERTQEIKSKNLQLENQTEKLKELDTMKTRLFANISHEFRTPLTLIKGPVEKLEEAGETKLSMTNIKMIRRNANRLLKLVNQLLDLSKLDSGKLQLNAAEGDLFKCLRAAASSFSSHAAQRDIDYQISIPSKSFWANFDRDKIEKITYNLLSNAFKFTQDNGKIKFKVSYRGERLQLVVSDSGQGIAKDKLPHIFDRFFQVDDSYTREKAGSGIGLALTKELVDLMQGEIYVESEFEKGSVFKVVMDIEEIKSHKKPTSEEYKIVEQDVIETETPLVQTEKKSHQILIIEDNNDMRHFIKEQLQNEYEVIEAFNGIEGLKKANKVVPDLIITDLMMPQMDGITLCKELKVGIHTSHIPVVMLTAKAGIENKLEGLETGADDYLTKPFNARELQVRVKNLINERQKLRELYAQKPDINPKEITVTSLDEKFLSQVLELLEEKYIESEFGVPQMQDALGMSKTQLHRKLKALTDHPPGELLRNFRLKRAAQLLLQKGENVSQIAYAVGFNGLSYFTKCFKELYGVAPSDYNKKDSSDS